MTREPCPRCGAQPAMYSLTNGRKLVYYVRCDCGAHTKDATSTYGADKAWSKLVALHERVAKRGTA